MKRKKCLFTLLGTTLMFLSITSSGVANAATTNSNPTLNANLDTPLNLEKLDECKTSKFDEQDIQLNTATGTIYGTLTKAQKHNTGLVVLIIAGSGPTDRNCNSAATGISTDAYKMIAYELAKNGISAGKDPMGLAATVLYLSSLKTGENITQHDISNAAGITEVTLRNRVKDLRSQLDLNI